ncbi:MAG: type II toxin-antitoxin system prevent-host-death family antitoxin [Deltaproteobacteria bacterium]|nr:type II toxin-antitoxin system prevent-host-death family antitoxin [Deltaproteobacteria bacterium]
MQVGTAELRNRLSYFIAKVRRGARIVVTDRGRPVAELVPMAREGDLAARIEEMVREGGVTAETVRRRAEVRPLALHRPGVRVSQLVAGMREER